MTAFVAVFLPLTVTLGFWQLDRAAEKRALTRQYLDRLTALPAPVTRADLTRPFERVRLTGAFAGEGVFLVDNQVLSGATGYWLVHAFDDVSGGRYLVNRGFVRGAPTRAELPAVEAPRGRVVVTGMVWPFTGLIPVLDEDVWPTGWPKRVQRLDVARMAAAVDAAPVEIRLEPGQPGVTDAAPFARVLDDGMHRGYAATWFGLAAALSVLFGIYGVRRGQEHPGRTDVEVNG